MLDLYMLLFVPLGVTKKEKTNGLYESRKKEKTCSSD